MRLLDRISTLIKADAHGVLESMEDRRLLAKQFVREAKIALDGKRARLGELKSDQERLTLESKRLIGVMARLDDDVKLAMQSGDEALARSAIRKLLPLREADRRLSARMVTLRDEEARLSERLSVQEQEFEVLRARLQAELATSDIDEGSQGTFETPVITDDDVELELLRRRQNADAPAAKTPEGGVE